jgi:DNA replication protein DnaC
MATKTAFEDVLREYERDRDKARASLERKRRKVYEQIPRVAAIDDRLKLCSLQIARQIISGAENPKEALRQLREENEALLREKKSLLANSRFGVDYLTETYRCPRCKDMGFIGTEKCACLKQRLIEKHYEYSNLMGVLSTENFNAFDARFFSQEIVGEEGFSPRDKILGAKKICLEFIDAFEQSHGKSGGNLMFYGNPGLGKTFLCHCVAKEILDKGWTVLYVTAPHVFKTLENYRFYRREMEDPDETIRMLMDVDLLIIDDLGTEVPNVVTGSELYSLVNSRILDVRSTLISTNLSTREMEKTYSERLTSRLFGYYRVIKFIGDDVRMKKKYAQTKRSHLA